MRIDKTWYQRPPGVPEHTSSGGVVVCKVHGRLHVALVRESGHSAYVLPKGHVEPGESLDRAARREIMEEAGLTDLTLLGELAVRERLDFEKRGWKRTHYFLYLTTQTSGVPTDARHPPAVTWFPLDALPPMFWPEQRELFETHRKQIVHLVESTHPA